MEEDIIVHNEFGYLKTEFSQNTENRSKIINQMKQNLISRNGNEPEITINNITYNIDTITIDKVSDLFLIDFELYHHMNFLNEKRKSQICEIPNPTDYK